MNRELNWKIFVPIEGQSKREKNQLLLMRFYIFFLFIIKENFNHDQKR